MKKSDHLFLRFLSAILTAVMLLTTLTSIFTVSAENGAASVNDGGLITFEDGSFPEDVSGSAVADATVIAPAPGSGHGDYSLKRNYTTGNVTVRIYRAVKAGHTYNFSMYYYMVENTENRTKYTPWFAVFCGGKQVTAKYDATYNTWRNFNYKFTAEADAEYIDLVAAEVDAYFDDISLAENTNNSDYQRYDFDTIPMAAGSGTVNIVPVNGADGKPTSALKLTYPSSVGGKDEAYTALDAPLTAGESYKLSFDYTGSAVVRNMFNMQGWTPQQIITVNAPNTEIDSMDGQNHGLKTEAGEWKHYEIDVTANDSWAGMIFLTQNLANFTDFEGGTDIYFDNVVIERIVSYSVAAGAAEGGTATVSAETAVSGSRVTFTAVADMGYMFVGWKDSEGNIISTSAVYNHTVTADTILTPVFETFKYAEYDFEDGLIPAGCPDAVNYSPAASPDGGNGAYSLKHTSSNGSYNTFLFKSVKLLAGHTYMISYDYFADSSVSDANNFWQRIDLYSADDKYLDGSGVATASGNYNKWLTTGRRTEITEDGQYFGIMCSGEIYFDNIVIIDVSDTGEYYEDFSERPELALIDLGNSANAEITYVNDEIKGNVAVVSYNGGISANNIALPFSLEKDVTYRIRMTVKTEGWFTASYDGTKLDGANGIKSSEWTAHSWYVTGSDTNKSFYIATNESAAAKIYIADISVDIEKRKGDINNDGDITADDLAYLRKLLLGIPDNDIFETAADVNEDGYVNIIDLVKLKKKLSGVADVVDDASTLSLVYSSSNVQLEQSSLINLGDGSRFKRAVSGQDAYVIYRVANGITEAAIEYDLPVSCMENFTFEISNDASEWTAVSAQDVNAKEFENVNWIKYTEYLDRLGNSKYLKINFPSPDSNIDLLPGIRQVQINGVDGNALYSMFGYNSKLRSAKTFYIDSAGGNDSNDGLSAERAFRSIEKAFERTFVPGDRILFARGGTYSGSAELLGSGAENAAIAVGAYGEGDMPVVTGFDETSAIKVYGEYVEITDIEFTCPEGKNAISFYSDTGGAARGIKVSNCRFHDINSLETSESFNTHGTGGISFYGLGSRPSWFENAVVENNAFNKLGRDSVFVTSEWSCSDKKQKWGNRNLAIDGAPVFRSKNITVRNNKITGNAGDAILLIGVESSVIEYNTVADSILIGDRTDADIAWASVWYHSSYNSVIQYNEVYGNSGSNGGHDLQAFDLDIACDSCIVQYNYSHDNDGGFMLLCGTEASDGGAVRNSVVRYNLSVNDGIAGLSVFDITGSAVNSQIYNNTVFCGKNDVKLINFANYQKVNTLSSGTVFTNNIFYAADNVTVTYGYGDANTAPALSGAVFNSNVFFNITAPEYERLIAVNESKTADPELVSAGADYVGREAAGSAYKPKSGSYVLAGGKTVPDNGGRDYFGNEISSDSLLIGAVGA